jgi:ferrous iron transport protein B
LVEAIPVVFLGVLFINLLLYFRLFDLATKISEPIVRGVFGLPKESVVALLIGFIRKDVAVGMLAPLQLTVKQLFIAATLLAISFPCVATFAIMLKELGFKALIKATAIMLITGLIVGAILNFSMIH